MVTRRIASKKALEIALERVKWFESPKELLEQYVTPSPVAADMLWEAYMAGDIMGRLVIDLGCGTGKLSYGSLLLGARQVLCLDIDVQALHEAEDILHDAEREGIAYVIACDCIGRTPLRSVGGCVVIMNPPFGVRRRGADVEFLAEAVRLCGTVYSIHKWSSGLTKAIRRKLSKVGLPAEVKVLKTIKLPIRWFLPKHRRKVHYVDAAIVKTFRRTPTSTVKSN